MVEIGLKLKEEGCMEHDEMGWEFQTEWCLQVVQEVT